MSNLGQSVVAQLEAVLAEIETRTAHRQRCPAYPATVRIGDAPSGHNTYTVTTLWCECDRLARVRTEIARTVERMLDAAWSAGVSTERYTGYPTTAHRRMDVRHALGVAVRARPTEQESR